MRPYNKTFIYEELKRYSNMIIEKNCGNYKIVKSKIKNKELKGYMHENKEEYDTDIICLYKNNTVLKKFLPCVVEGSYWAISSAYGKVGIVGIGIGYVVQEIAKKKRVKEVIVYEEEEELIELYKSNFSNNSKIKIIKENPFKAQKRKFDFFYINMNDFKLNSKIVEDYKKFNQLHEIEEYSFYGLEHFLLNCKYEDIVWVYIPENWISMSKKAYEALDSSGYIKKYKHLDEEIVKQILLEFKEILNA